ncbi:exopolyphosphatase [Neptuniibacter sp. 1_MG-2023]|jgi:exopolyphosphatase/guanosine-5'-triphosphate,3'-diphosphate pyrophosphatase|uniref:exopolyphosphatase n=1 Tax=Neptuniibacter sp. 1_MG-2023 TaxID=3062662 RepID=UPI0026E4360D|nr:exopolyphosphatase [Neptuniibacter sp. 1_MG-2023]MDO6594520.1 exopolyphosphatase [Neptuniibacter sp. 1_MG-2023]
MTEQNTASENIEEQFLAAIDLGSNSFHIVVAQLSQGELRTVDVMSDKVQLAAGINDKRYLTDEAKQRGLECLSRFAQRIKDLPRDAVRVVGTNALREAKNSREFIEEAESILGTPLEIIAGREEARLIYLGVAHTLADDKGARLVVDIGGGSTEFIIGERFEPNMMESLHMGCVSFTQRYFPDDIISAKNFKRAQTAALQELQSIKFSYKDHGWNSTVGSSGTIKAVRNACISNGWSDDRITKDALHTLKDKILSFDNSNDIDIEDLKPERRKVFPAGVAILCAAFEALDIEEMHFSEGALREGVLYDMAGRLRHEDVRDRTINAIMQRYHVDQEQADRVEQTALIAWAQVKEEWQLSRKHYDMLSWAAKTHEIGLTIAHSQFHKHSAYLLTHADLPGFTTQEQLQLATLVRGHRRKFPKDDFKALPKRLQEPYTRLCVLLRIAVVLHRSRSKDRLPAISFSIDNKKLIIEFPEGWLEHHPLTLADLEQETEYLNSADIKLRVQ